MSTSCGRWCLHILASLDSTRHTARWSIRVERRGKHQGMWLFQFSWRLYSTLWQAKWFPSQKPWCASRAYCIFSLWHGSGTILMPPSSRWGIIFRSFIVTTMCSVNSAAENLQRRSPTPWTSSLLWANRRNRSVTPLRIIFLRLQSIVTLMKVKHRSSQKLHNILSTNRNSSLWRCISWTTSLTVSASLATS